MPKRRFVQAFFLVLFLTLFFYYGDPHRIDYHGDTGNPFSWLKLFLLLDPLVAVSASIATRVILGPLIIALGVLGFCVFIPRWFCVYVCPLGTSIDLVDACIKRCFKPSRILPRSGWAYGRFALLAGVLGAAVSGVLLSGYVAALPLFTRGIQFLTASLSPGLDGASDIPPLHLGYYLSIAILGGILGLGLLQPRFWCAYLCPSGALMSLPSLLGGTRRQVKDNCSHCGRCRHACSFNAIADDYSTQRIHCTLCRSCQDVCPKDAIAFKFHPHRTDKAITGPTPLAAPCRSRRHFIGSLIGGTGMGIGVAAGLDYDRKRDGDPYPIRPPGSIPEAHFRTQCVRCGQCMRICPSQVLQPAGFELGFDGLWTPVLNTDLAACHPQCHNCGQVCPTHAIRELPQEEKRAARMGLAVIDTHTCLPHTQKEACSWCVDACSKAGYHAIEYRRIDLDYDQNGRPIADSGFLAPIVIADKCVGCGQCQVRCRAKNVIENNLLTKSAVEIKAGPGKEDRLLVGSYRELATKRQNRKEPKKVNTSENDYLPDFLR